MSFRLKDSLDHLLLAETQSLQARLSALQSQMNPHFLYNTLANLQEMAEQNMNDTLVLTIERMSDFLRYMTSKERQVPLRDELDHTVNYLEINKVRFGGRLEYRVQMPDSMLAQVVPSCLFSRSSRTA
jgi:sensor histidine kinase YesM